MSPTTPDPASEPDAALDARLHAALGGAGREAASGAADHPDEGRLLAWRRGELAGTEAAAAAAHLEACADCRALLAELTAALPDLARRRALASLPAPRRALPLPLVGGIAALAAAAGLALFLRGGAPPATVGSAWPEHVLEGPTGGLREVRSPGEASRRFDAHSRFELVLRPQGPLPGTMPLSILVSREGGPTEALPADCLQREPNGVALVSCPAPRVLSRGPGRYRILLVGGPEGAAARPQWEVSAELVEEKHAPNE